MTRQRTAAKETTVHGNRLTVEAKAKQALAACTLSGNSVFSKNIGYQTYYRSRRAAPSHTLWGLRTYLVSLKALRTTNSALDY